MEKTNSNGQKIVLDLCGGTGSWSKPYKDNGYEVINVTIPEYDVRTFIPPDNVYGILAAPPCTMFSLARTRAKKPRDFNEGLEIVKACLDIIWQCRIKNKLAFWAMENPMGYLRQFLGKPYLTFNPFEFGDPYYKKTDVWGYFNVPKRKPIEPRYRVPGKPDWHHNAKEKPKDMPKEVYRAITPKGFAEAFYKENT